MSRLQTNPFQHRGCGARCPAYGWLRKSCLEFTIDDNALSKRIEENKQWLSLTCSIPNSHPRESLRS